MQTFTEPTIDRSFDQTAKHEHVASRLCPLCNLLNCELDPGPALIPTADRKKVSPAVLETQIIELSEAVSTMSKRAIEAEAENDALKARVRQFERMTSGLAVKLDENTFQPEHSTGEDSPNV